MGACSCHASWQDVLSLSVFSGEPSLSSFGKSWRILGEFKNQGSSHIKHQDINPAWVVKMKFDKMWTLNKCCMISQWCGDSLDICSRCYARSQVKLVAQCNQLMWIWLCVWGEMKRSRGVWRIGSFLVAEFHRQWQTFVVQLDWHFQQNLDFLIAPSMPYSHEGPKTYMTPTTMA